VLVGEGKGKVARAHPDWEKAAALLTWVAVAFVVLGGFDVALAWWPTFIGNAEWEFGTYTATLNNLPIVLLGVGLLVAAGMARGRPLLLWCTGGVALLIALGLVLGMFMYLTDIPIALKSVTDPTARLGLKKAVTKSLVQGVIYVMMFLAAGVAAWRHTRRRPGMAKGAAV
jgi:hypothetical protein